MPGGYAAVVLAGGAGRRLGGPGKPVTPVAGEPMLHRVLTAVADARERIVVGPPVPVPAGVRVVLEDPPGGGPATALVAGLGAVDPDIPVLAVLAADLPLLTPAAVSGLRAALERADSTVDGVLYVDDDGRRQLLCGVWRAAVLRTAVRPAAAAGAHPPERRGPSMRAVVGALTITELAWSGGGPPPWFDCDTEADRRRAEEWLR